MPVRSCVNCSKEVRFDEQSDFAQTIRTEFDVILCDKCAIGYAIDSDALELVAEVNF